MDRQGDCLMSSKGKLKRKDWIYLDYNSTSFALPEVKDAMLPFLGERSGNPSSMHRFGQEAREALDEAREKVACSMDEEAVDIIFTASGTEANNMAILGLALAEEKRKHIVTTQIEHMAVLKPCEFLEHNAGFEVTYVPPSKYGYVEPEAIREALREDTLLVSLMAANNEVGTIQPINEVAEIVKEKDVMFHSDAVQVFGRIPVSPSKIGVDLLTVSAHKLGGPKGVGALFVGKDVELEPIIHGGHHERDLRAGTENIPGIVGFGKAAEITCEDMEKVSSRISKMRDKLETGIRREISDIIINTHPEKRLPNTLNVTFKGADGESVLIALDIAGIAVSFGSACTSGSSDPSHVLLSMGVPYDLARSSIRFSLGRGTSEKEIDYVLEKLPGIVSQVRKKSSKINL